MTATNNAINSNSVTGVRSQDFSLVASIPQLVGGGHSLNTFVFTHGNGLPYALVSGGTVTGTIELYSISNPLAPVLINTGNYTGSYNATAVVISGSTYVFIPSSGASTFIIINITYPTSWTTVVTKTVTGTSGSVYSGVYANGYYYCATQHNGLTVFDVGGGLAGGTLSAPVQTYQEGSAVQSFGVAISGNFVYTTQYTTSVFTTRQIKSWAITGAGTLAVPSLLQSLQITTVGQALGLTIAGNTAFVTASTTGTYAVDLIDITTPSAMTNLSVAPPSYSFNSAYVGVSVGSFLFIPSGSNATNGGAIDMYDISNRSAPLKVATTYSGLANDVFGGIAISGGYIYVGTYGVSAAIGPFSVYTMPDLSPVLSAATGSSLVLKNLPLTTGPIATISSGGQLGTAAGIITAPVSSSIASAAFGTSLTAGTAVQNTLGYDILLNISVAITMGIGATVTLGVGPTSTPTTNAVTNTIAMASNMSFCAIVPNNYYVLVNTTGTITIGAIVVQACPL